MTLKYIPIKLFFTEFSHMKYMNWEGLYYFLALYDGILLAQQLKITAQKINQELQPFYL